MYSCTVLASPRYPGSLSRCTPVVPSTNGGPTWPAAPGIPGMMWQTGQPGLVNISTSGSSPVTSGIFSGVRALVTVSSVRGREGGGSRNAQTTVTKTTLTVTRMATRSCGRVRNLRCTGGGVTEPESILNGYPVLRRRSSSLYELQELFEPTGFDLSVRCQFVD